MSSPPRTPPPHRRQLADDEDGNADADADDQAPGSPFRDPLDLQTDSSPFNLNRRESRAPSVSPSILNRVHPLRGSNASEGEPVGLPPTPTRRSVAKRRPSASPGAAGEMASSPRRSTSDGVDISPTALTFAGSPARRASVAPASPAGNDGESSRARQGSGWSSRPAPLGSPMEEDEDEIDQLGRHQRPSPARAQSSGTGLRVETGRDGTAIKPELSPMTLDIPARPRLVTASSSDALLADMSGQNTPITPLSDPFSNSNNSSQRASPRPSPEDDPANDPLSPVRSSLSPAPKIHINSIPNSPDPAQAAAFEPPRFTSPFPEPPASASASRHASSEMKRDASSRSLGASSAVEKSSIVERRKARMKDIKAGGNGRGHHRGAKSGGGQLNRKPFQSTRLKGEIYKPWLEKRDPAQRWARWITLASIMIGFAVAAVVCYDGYASVPSLGKTCLVLHDDFSSGAINTDYWTREVRLDGYGHGEFEWTTASDNNSFVQDSTLYLVPTLTADHIGADNVFSGYTLNLTADGTCTSTNVSQCVAVSNSSRLTVINPVMSARLTTRNSVSLKYGKVEVRARFPTGDWLWPSITLMPLNDTYGAWPRSGQIDILTARGNNASYPNRGVDYAQSDLHWGPTEDLDRLYLTWGYREQRRTYYNQKWHTFGLEWNDEFMWTYIDSRVSQVISLRFNKESFWTRGKFPSTVTNTTTGDITKLTSPWLSSENNVAPFDQAFYLVLSLGVGGTDGWFPDGEGGKPWLDDSGTGMSDFWAAKSKWWDNNWPSDKTKRGFAIDSVKMWETC